MLLSLVNVACWKPNKKANLFLSSSKCFAIKSCSIMVCSSWTARRIANRSENYRGKPDSITGHCKSSIQDLYLRTSQSYKTEIYLRKFDTMLRNWNFTIVITSISIEVKEKYCCLKSKWRRNIFLNKAAIYLRGNVGLMTPAIIYIYPGTSVRRFLNKLHFILSTTIEKNTRSTLEPQRNDVHVGDHVLLREVFQKVLRQNKDWGFTEYVISFSTCRFKAVCIRNNEFSISANTRDSECSRTDNKGKQFFLCAAEWIRVPDPKSIILRQTRRLFVFIYHDSYILLQFFFHYSSSSFSILIFQIKDSAKKLDLFESHWWF